MTAHNKYGLTGGPPDNKGCTNDRSQVLPFSAVMFSDREGWQQHGVYETREKASLAAKRLGAQYDCQAAVADTIRFLDCTSPTIWDLAEIEPSAVDQLADVARKDTP